MTGSTDEGIPQESEKNQTDEEGLVPEPSTCPEEEKSPLEILQAEYDDLHGRYLRLAADFENFRKRSARDMEQRTSSMIERFARDMLEVADSLDRAQASEKGAHEGLNQIQKLFATVLDRQGIRSFPSEGEKFDPVKHEAIAYLPSDKKEGMVCNEVCKGYCLNDKVIRCAQVTVSKGNDN